MGSGASKVWLDCRRLPLPCLQICSPELAHPRSELGEEMSMPRVADELIFKGSHELGDDKGWHGRALAERV